MKALEKTLISTLLLFVVYSCAPTTPRMTTKEIMQTWIGSHQSELIRQWGAYTRTIDDGAGGKILIWEEHFTKSSTTTPFTLFGTTYYSHSGGGSGVRYRDVFINKDGVITNIKWGKR
ncbi:MAG: hypothetical protein H8E71_06610 [Candidatus Marinimicrobia bacterium]|nr:hypothetical protein [Candidatus Neomarinimicrobiota bacterium]MBL7109583.1 hypothetical protein [Candidatus Neomarinimicrobiota bacterium]